MNYLTYPTKTMKITQGYTGNYSHSPNSSGSPKDYPWDEAGIDSGRDYFYCPCDKMKVVRIYGVGSRGTNTVWLESTDKVVFADGTSDYVLIMIVHPNDDDLKKLKKGQIFTRGQQICREGTDGHSTGNHLHISAAKGKYNKGWVQNSKGKWVISSTNGAYKPEQLFFIDPSFTTIKNSKGLNFKEKPKEISKKGYETGNYRVIVDVLNVRKKATTASSKIKFKNMSANAQAKIKKLAGKPVDGYVKGLAFTALEVKGKWGRTPSGWVCLKYCERI